MGDRIADPKEVDIPLFHPSGLLSESSGIFFFRRDGHVHPRCRRIAGTRAGQGKGRERTDRQEEEKRSSESIVKHIEPF